MKELSTPVTSSTGIKITDELISVGINPLHSLSGVHKLVGNTHVVLVGAKQNELIILHTAYIAAGNHTKTFSHSYSQVYITCN